MNLLAILDNVNGTVTVDLNIFMHVCKFTDLACVLNNIVQFML